MTKKIASVKDFIIIIEKYFLYLYKKNSESYLHKDSFFAFYPPDRIVYAG